MSTLHPILTLSDPEIREWTVIAAVLGREIVTRSTESPYGKKQENKCEKALWLVTLEYRQNPKKTVNKSRKKR